MSSSREQDLRPGTVSPSSSALAETRRDAQQGPSFSKEEVRAVAERAYRNHAGELIAMLQAVQEELGYVPGAALRCLASMTGYPLARFYGVATFYNSLRLEPKGKQLIRICTGTACHVAGATQVTDAAAKALGTEPGHTREDGAYTLETVACLGCCSLAPVVMVDEEAHGRVTPGEVSRLFAGESEEGHGR